MDMLRVRPGCSVVLPDHSLLSAGQMVARDKMPSRAVEDWIKSGHVEALSVGRAETKPDEETATPPGADLGAPPLPNNDPKAPISKQKAVTVNQPVYEPPPAVDPPATSPLHDNRPVIVAIKEKPPVTVKTVESKWVLNPADLKAKSIEDLNAMIFERDANVKPFDTPEEAIAFLSADYRP